MITTNYPNKIIIHHSAETEPNPQLDMINKAHEQRGFNVSTIGFYVGYHFLIEKDGTQIQTRDCQEFGCHCLGQNYNSIGICLAGNFMKEMPTDAQIATLGQLLDTLCITANINPQAIYPHRLYSATACYGDQLADAFGILTLNDFRQKKSQSEPTCIKPIKDMEAV